MGAALSRDAPPGAGWLPGWAGWRDGAFCVEWCHFGRHPLHEPFFADSLARVMRRPVNQLLRHRTPVEALQARVAQEPGLAPRGFVFHSSRCGSTLIAQLLAATRGSVVLSEAAPLDAVLGATAAPDGKTVPVEQRARWLAWMLGALGAPRRPGDARLFVKFDAWHTLELPLLRSVFPDVPWVFLYRDPREVLVSQLRQPGGFLVPGVLERAGRLGGLGLAGDTLAERVATLLADTCEAALAALPIGGGLLVNYAELPGAFEDVIAPHFGLELDAAERAAIDEAARMDAKSPGMGWAKPEAREAALGEAELALLEERVMPVYRELERCRKNIQTRTPGPAALRPTP